MNLGEPTKVKRTPAEAAALTSETNLASALIREMRYQRRKWGGPAHDEAYNALEWAGKLAHQVTLATSNLPDHLDSVALGTARTIAFEGPRFYLVELMAMVGSLIRVLDERCADVELYRGLPQRNMDWYARIDGDDTEAADGDDHGR